jgi:hypothetical protein
MRIYGNMPVNSSFLLFLINIEKLILLDKVFFKILASETDFDFEENLAIFLPKLLLKLATNEEIVRKKVKSFKLITKRKTTQKKRPKQEIFL